MCQCLDLSQAIINEQRQVEVAKQIAEKQKVILEIERQVDWLRLTKHCF